MISSIIWSVNPNVKYLYIHLQKGPRSYLYRCYEDLECLFHLKNWQELINLKCAENVALSSPKHNSKIII